VVRAGGQASGLAANSAWQGSGETTVTAGAAGATLLRWELARAASQPDAATGDGVASALTLSRPVGLEEPGGRLMRCDRVDFPPGGVAYTHVHRGPGIRCLLAGSLRVEVDGKAHDVVPGGAWFEAGPDPVLALASKSEPTAFVRVMILPRELKGKSSIRYVKPEDADKPKTQTYRVFADEFIELP
jgi:quercetin dioxygenase-like cupin family protein